MFSIFFQRAGTVILIAIIVLFEAFPVFALSADTFNNQTISLINTERQKAGISPLKYSGVLFQAAFNHNSVMSACSTIYGASACFLHQVTQENEPTLMIRINQLAYNAQSVAENIGWGYTSPSAMVAGWMASPGHKANILNNTYLEIGCSYLNSKGLWWTCDFGKSFMPVSSPGPTITPTSKPTTIPTLTPVPTSILSPTPKIIPTPQPVPASTSNNNPLKPWWCNFIYISSFCLGPKLGLALLSKI